MTAFKKGDRITHDKLVGEWQVTHVFYSGDLLQVGQFDDDPRTVARVPVEGARLVPPPPPPELPVGSAVLANFAGPLVLLRTQHEGWRCSYNQLPYAWKDIVRVGFDVLFDAGADK